MPQEFMILKCFRCSMFQVHQVRKSKVWKCKLCNEKQSQQKIYGQGSGKDCRMLVQQFNMKKQELDDDCLLQFDDISGGCDDSSQKNSKEPGPSKWGVYKTNSNLVDNQSDGETGSDRQMTSYDIKPIITSATLNSEDWSGCKKRRLGVQKTRQDKRDAELVAKQLKQTLEEKENKCFEVTAPKVPKFSRNIPATVTDNTNASSRILAKSSTSIISHTKKTSAWHKFGALGNESSSSSEDDDGDLVL